MRFSKRELAGRGAGRGNAAVVQGARLVGKTGTPKISRAKPYHVVLFATAVYHTGDRMPTIARSVRNRLG